MNNNISKPGVLVTFEGVEGVGKTTLIRFIIKYLSHLNVPLLVTREPGGTPLADDIRHFLLSQHAEQMQPETELLLIFAARAQHLQNVIRPALKAGKLIICDRFTDTSYAYQGAGRGVDRAKIEILEKTVQDGLKPDLTILLDAPLDVCLARIVAREKADRFESESKSFFEKARRAYLQMSAAEPKRFRVIDTARPMKVVGEEVVKLLQPIIKTVTASENVTNNSCY